MVRRAIPTDVDQRVRQAAGNRCGYCLSPQHLVMARLEIEHIIPLARGGSDDESNFWLPAPSATDTRVTRSKQWIPRRARPLNSSIHVRKSGRITSSGQKMAFVSSAKHPSVALLSTPSI